MVDEHVAAVLRDSLGPGVVLDEDIGEQYVTDWTGRFVGSPMCVVRPRRVEDVVRIMEATARLGIPLVPQGGNTGLVGATMAPHRSVLVNLGLLNEISPSDDPETLKVGAGVTIAEVHDEAKVRGRVFGVDMASRGSATVGGAIATNAGGLRVCRWGRMGAQVTDVEVVLADGTIVPGGDRSAVETFVGSEGTLGVITGATLTLRDPPPPSTVLLARFADLSDAYSAASSLENPLAAEFFGDPELDAVVDVTGLRRPFDDAGEGWYLLCEVESDRIDRLSLPGTTLAGADLWEYRDRITESVSRLGVIHKFDVLVPPPLLESLADELRARLSPHRLFVFGHLLARDVHLNVAPATSDVPVFDGVDEIVYDAVERVGGVVAGEHGVGRVKADRVWASLSEEQRRIVDEQNRRLDPDGRLNPGVGRRFD